MNGQFKDLRKAAFAMGFGFTMGKVVAKYAEAIIDGMILGVAESAAEHGSKIAQEVCNKAKIDVEQKEEEVESK